ncbi:MAG: CoB--CoM heterodisulfide reductase iron-sulfur subunit B family protein [Candidatus Heimdallarchaeota archaeon]
MPEYALYPGCLVSYRYPHLELAVRKITETLNVRLEDMEGTSCCPEPQGIQSTDKRTWMALAARNIAIAEEMGKDILTLCNGCFETLKSVNVRLKRHPELKEDVNQILATIDKEFKGTIRVKNIIHLFDDIGISTMHLKIEKPMTHIRTAVHYGCHMLRPSDILEVVAADRPTMLDHLVELTGAKPVEYEGKVHCCGYPVRNFDPELSLRLAHDKLFNIQRSAANCITLLCPCCFSTFDTRQALVNRTFGTSFNIPSFHYAELLALALGYTPEELALDRHRVKLPL